MSPSTLLEAGEVVRLTDPKGRHHTFVLEAGGRFHSHRGSLSHDALIGLPEGSVLSTEQAVEYLVMRPLLEDYVLSMPRGAAIIYPKDATQILQRADIHPGQTVLEAGLGSGALSLWLHRVLGPEGTLVSVDRREDFVEIARGNVETFYRGSPPAQWDIRTGELNDVLADQPDHSLDRIILDMLAPWECLEQSLRTLVPGGVILCYVATVTQLSRVIEALRDTERTTEPEASETLNRPWHVEGLAVRPEHRMIGHTAFLCWARTLAPGATLPVRPGKKVKPDYLAEDIEAWTPGAVGQRTETAKKIRQLQRESTARADKARRAEPTHPVEDTRSGGGSGDLGDSPAGIE